MKKRLKQIVCLLISVMLIVGSLPIGVLAEEVNQPTPTTTETTENLIEEGFAPTTVAVPTAPEPAVTATEVAPETEPVLVTPEVNQSMSTAETVTASETMTTMATDGAYVYDDTVAGVATITKYTGTATTVTIPTTLGGRKVVAIGAGAFNGITTVQKIIVPLTVTTIASGDAAATYPFGDCSSLTEVLIPTSVKTIGAFAFSNTTGVKILCYKGSQAELYAIEHGMAREILSFSSTLAASLPSGQNINTDIKLTAVATGGTGTLNYRFSYDLIDQAGASIPGNTIQDWSTTSSAPYTLLEAGTYTFYVEVEDGAGNTTSNVIDNYKVIDQPIVTYKPDPASESPQYVDSPIKLIASVTGGTGPYTYEFSHQVGTSKIVDQTMANQAATSMVWNKSGFSEPGTYTFYVKVTDSYGKETIKTIADFKIYNKLNIDSFTVDKAQPQELGTELKLTATTSGGKTASEYKYSYTVDGGTEVVIEDYSDQSSITFTPPKTGIYVFKVAVTNAYGLVKTEAVTGYKIQDTPVIGNFTAAKADGTPFYVGDTAGIVLKAEGVAEGKTPYSYKYFYQNGTGAKTEIAAVDSTNFKPSDAGTYTFFVEVTDDNGLKTERQVSNYVVYPKLDGTLVFPASQNRETTVKFAATATGGKSPYKYQFFYKLESETDDQYIPMTDEPSTTKTFSKYFSDPEKYEIKLEITDANGIMLTLEKPLEIKNNPLIDEFNITGDAFYAGTEMDITATVDPIASVDAGSTLVLTGKMGTKSITIPNSTITTVVATNTFKFTPNAAGTYSFTVTLKNADGTIADTKTLSSIKVLATPSAKAVKVSKTTGVLLHDEVKLTAGATGGKTAYQYQFYVKTPSGASPVAINASFATANNIIYKMEEVGSYTFYVKVIDDNNEPSGNFNESASVPVKVTNPPVITDFKATKLNLVPTDVVYAQDQVELKIMLEDNKGVGDLNCEFFYKQGTKLTPIGTAQTVLATGTNRSATANANFIPPVAGTYSLIAVVTDAQGSKVTTTKTGYKVLPLGTTKAVKISKVTGLLQGDTIKLTATASGGKTPYSYDFYVTEPGGAVNPIFTTDKKLAYTNYKLEKVGNYKFSAVITDFNGVILATTTQTLSEMVSVTNPPDLKPLTVTKNQTVGTHTGTPVAYENDTLTITATPNDGTGVPTINYVFEAKLGTTVVDTQTNTTGTFIFTKTKAGSYTFTVTATDGQGSKDVAKQSSYKVLPDVTTKSIKASKTTGLIVGETIKLTAAGSGGKSPYTYAFYYYLDDSITPVTVPSSDPKSRTASLALPGKGNYKFHVVVKDANGVISTNADNLDVSTTATVGNPPVIESLVSSKLKGSPVYPNDNVLLTAKVKTGTGLQLPDYQFYYTLGTSRIDIPTTIGTDPYTATGTFTPPQAGSYNLCVDVFDGTNTVTQKITSYKVLPAVAVKTFKADKASGVNINTTVKLTAVATGGKAPYMYEFIYYGQGDVIGTTPPKIIKAYSTDATANFIPSVQGFYTLMVNVKDATGKVCSTSGIIQDFEVFDNPAVKTFKPSLLSGQYVETSIDLTAEIDGGSEPYTYNFAYQINGGATEQIPAATVEATVSKTNKATLKLPSAGTYTFTVTVTDLNGNTSELKKIENYVVYAEPVLKSVTVSKAEIIVGGSVTVKAVAEGGKKALKYKFVFTGDKGTVVERDYSTTSSYYFKPTAAEIYTVKVYVQDANLPTAHTAELEGDKTITVSPKTP